MVPKLFAFVWLDCEVIQVFNHNNKLYTGVFACSPFPMDQDLVCQGCNRLEGVAGGIFCGFHQQIGCDTAVKRGQK